MLYHDHTCFIVIQYFLLLPCPAQATEKDIRDLCNELNLLASVGEHSNIVGLIGACSVAGKTFAPVIMSAPGPEV